MKTDFILDTAGRFCPVPVIETANRFKEMRPGETLTVISDDPVVTNDIRTWCSRTGNDFLGMDEDGGEFRAYIRKGAR